MKYNNKRLFAYVTENVWNVRDCIEEEIDFLQEIVYDGYTNIDKYNHINKTINNLIKDLDDNSYLYDYDKNKDYGVFNDHLLTIDELLDTVINALQSAWIEVEESFELNDSSLKDEIIYDAIYKLNVVCDEITYTMGEIFDQLDEKIELEIWELNKG